MNKGFIINLPEPEPRAIHDVPSNLAMFEVDADPAEVN